MMNLESFPKQTDNVGSRITFYQEKIRDHLQTVDTEQSVQLKLKEQSDNVFMSSQNDLLMRNLYVVIDGTKHSTIADFKPTRLGLVIKYLPIFMQQFLEQNPLSQFGLGIALPGECLHVLDFTSSSKNIENVLSTLKPSNQSGFSLYTCLQTALSQFSESQVYITQQIIFIQSSPYSDDKRDVLGLIEKCAKSGVRVDVISFCGVLNVLRRLVQDTQGLYLSPVSELDFQKHILSLSLPTIIAETKLINSMVQIGFPMKMLTKHAMMCMCHLDLVAEFYKCPRCLSKVCNVPIKCPVCDLWLALPNQIMRSKKNELKVFKVDAIVESESCYGCEAQSVQSVRCPDCSNFFCVQCDILLHQSIKMCPGCA